MNPEDLRTIGMVIGAHGLQGTLKVNPLSDFPERYATLESVYLMRGDSVVELRVKQTRWSNQHVLISLIDLTTRDEAETMIGAEVCVPLSESWKLPDGIYYATDLIGFAGIADDGTELGVLKDIHSGAQDLLAFVGLGKELLVPFVSEWVGRVDLQARTIEILHWQRLVEGEEIPPSATDDH
jgi:16S rRNA processing protein RimM